MSRSGACLSSTFLNSWAGAARPSGLDRLATRADLGDHAAHQLDADAVGDLDLDLGVVGHLGDLAHDAARADDRVPAADVLDDLLVLPRPPLLRADDQE